MPKAITITQIPGQPGSVYYPLSLTPVPHPTANPPSSPTHLIIKILSASLNHRDLFIRQHLYPGTAFSIPLLADGCGVVVGTGSDPSAQQWHGKRVVINPGLGWKSDPSGPEDQAGYRILGGTKHNPNGTLQEYMVIEASEVEEVPPHLSDVEAAALPLTGLTAWRAVMTKLGSGNLGPGKRVLVTGIGGGVALMALAVLVGMGTEVWVTSGSQEKVGRAVELGARGGVGYREERWEKRLLELVGEEEGGGKGLFFDGIVDGAGGDVVEKGARILKPGGVIVSYGMTLGPKMPFLMQAVMKNIEVKGSTMGSRKEFKDMIDFVRRKEMRPVVSRTVQGIDNIEGIDSLFEDMKNGSQFGKLVIEVAKDGGNDSKL